MEYKVLAERDVIWLSSIIDGEGCIFLKKSHAGRNVCHSLEIEVAMTDYPAVKKCQEITGLGSFRPSRRTYKENHRQAWRWVVTSQEALTVIRLILPYLIVKKDQADLALEFGKLKENHPGRKGLSEDMLNTREEMFQKMKDLKRIEYKIEDYWEE